jgi:hypothetical protein
MLKISFPKVLLPRGRLSGSIALLVLFVGIASPSSYLLGVAYLSHLALHVPVLQSFHDLSHASRNVQISGTPES